MPPEDKKFFPGLGVPNAGCSVLGRREESPAVRGEDDRIYVCFVPLEGDKFGTRGGVQNAGSIVVAAERRHTPSIGGERHPCYTFMLEFMVYRTGRGVPHPEDTSPHVLNHSPSIRSERRNSPMR